MVSITAVPKGRGARGRQPLPLAGDRIRGGSTAERAERPPARGGPALTRRRLGERFAIEQLRRRRLASLSKRTDEMLTGLEEINLAEV